MKEQKLDVLAYEKKMLSVQEQIDLINKDLDSKESNIKGLEAFTDRYASVKTMMQLRESFKVVFSK